MRAWPFLLGIALASCAARERQVSYRPAPVLARLLDAGGQTLAELQATILAARVPLAPGADEGEVRVALRATNPGTGEVRIRPAEFRLLAADLRALPAPMILEGPAELRLDAGRDGRWLLRFPIPPPASAAEAIDARGLVLEWTIHVPAGARQGLATFDAVRRRPRAWMGPGWWISPAYPSPWYPYGISAGWVYSWPW